MMDDLERVIDQEIRDCVDGPARPGYSGNVERIAAAVRSWIASQEKLEDATKALDYLETASLAAADIQIDNLRQRIQKLEAALTRAESDFHLIALDSTISYQLQGDAKRARDNCRAALTEDNSKKHRNPIDGQNLGI